MRFALLAVSSLLVGAILAAGPPRGPDPPLLRFPEGGQAGDSIVYDISGRSVVGNYSVEIPAGLRAAFPWPRCLFIPLGDKRENRFIISGYEHGFSGNTPQGMTSGLVTAFRSDKNFSKVTVLRKVSLKLGPLAAERVVVKFRNANDTVDRVCDEVFALGRGGEDSYEYISWLVTTVELYKHDVRQFDAVLKSWNEQ